MIGTETALGVGPSNAALLYAILSPVGPYFSSGFKPVSLLADERYVRAFPGGTDGYKLGANYAPTVYPALEASKLGYAQILWLLGEKGEITEVGTMNLFIFWIDENGETELVTPPLSLGVVLPGVTRDSILGIARQWKEFKVSERRVTMADLLKAREENRLIEVFGAGTAAIVSPVKMISYKGKDYTIPLGKGNDPNKTSGELTHRLIEHILGIQYGEIESDWSIIV